MLLLHHLDKHSMKITGIVLAAGQSQRFGGDKMLHPILIDNTEFPMGVASALHLKPYVDNLACIVRPLDQKFKQALDNHQLPWVENPDFETGMSSSIKVGVRSFMQSDYLIVALGDMPYIQASTYQVLFNKIGKMLNEPEDTRPIIRTVYSSNKPSSKSLDPTSSVGHPVAFPSWAFSELLELKGDQGARTVLLEGQKNDCLIDISCSDGGIVRDQDTRDKMSE